MAEKTSKRLFKLFDETPAISSKRAAQLVGCPLGTAASTKNRWKKTRGYEVGSKSHPIGGLKKKKEDLVAKAIIGTPKEPLKPEDIADALLNRVVETLTKYDDLVSEVSELRGLKKEVPKLEHQLKEAKEETERVLKIHNEQVKSRKLTDAETLRKLAKI